MKLKAKHFAWIYLLKTGGVGKWSFYSGYNFDKNITQKAYHDILTHGINWKKTEAPTDSFEDTFEGTFCDATSTGVMDGVLRINNGEQYKFACTFAPDDIFEIMESIHGIETIEAFVAKELLKEL